jgi:hypothetical protein
LPPLKTTRSAPSARKARRFETGGNCAAASTITGTPRLRHTAATAGRSCFVSAVAENANAAVREPSAASISHASMPRTPAPVPRSLWPMSTIVAPAARSAWS